ncbi:uncharacterized protein LOC134271577 [Saccostrea cucullata]|uniref:uncharacterized protein LOC134271577 n=1 Tax=Saccostrea cuccullata TaxID=36930 RepID=UPI002ED056EA
MKMKVGFFDTVFIVQICLFLCFNPDETDYYYVLNVKRSASQAAINQAYKALSRKLHPDKNKCDPLANEKTILLNTASEFLRDKRKRSEYNRRYPKAGLKYTTWPYDWELQDCSGKTMDAGFKNYIRNNAVIGVQWVLGIAGNVRFIMRGIKLSSFEYGTILAVTASFVSTSPVILFILLWIFVVDRLHLILMVWMSEKFIKNIRKKYLPYLILMWIIYLSTLGQYDNQLFELGLSFQTVNYLSHFSNLLIIYITASILVTSHIFLKYQLHQNHYVQYTLYFLQQALAFNFLSENLPNEEDLDGLLVYHLMIILISYLFSTYVWLYIRSTLHDLCTFSRGFLERKSAFILNPLKKFIRVIIRKLGCIPVNSTMWVLCVQVLQEIWSKCNHVCHLMWTKCVQTTTEMKMKCVQTFRRLPHLASFCGKYICHRLKTWTLFILSTELPYLKTKIFQLCRSNHGTVQNRQLLSKAEYVMEGRFYTLAQLNQLRHDCLEMKVNAWRMANALTNVQRFSNFVLGENHVTAAEIEEHHRSCRIYPQSADSESSSESE